MPEIPTLTLVDAWMILLGVAAPVIAALINQPGWSVTRRRYVAAAVCAILAIIYGIATRAVDLGLGAQTVDALARIIISAAVITTIAQGIYKALTPTFTALQGEPAPE